MYNPFVPFTETLFNGILREGTYHFVIQRFSWPAVQQGKGFMVSPYSELTEAQAHAVQLGPKEGKLLDARTDLATIQRLVAKGSGYRLYLNRFREENWKSRMMKLYRDKIISYLRFRTPFRSRDTIDITFSLAHGRVIATITNGDRTVTARAVDLIS